MKKTDDESILPLLPLRDVVVFPHMVIPLFVGRPDSVAALEMAMEMDKHIFLVAQKEANVEQRADPRSSECVHQIAQLEFVSWTFGQLLSLLL